MKTPAFPLPGIPAMNDGSSNGQWHQNPVPGMTTQEYAAIHLKVPNSGNPELDKVIREARMRDDASRIFTELTAAAPDLTGDEEEDYGLACLAALAAMQIDKAITDLEGRGSDDTSH